MALVQILLLVSLSPLLPFDSFDDDASEPISQAIAEHLVLDTIDPHLLLLHPKYPIQRSGFSCVCQDDRHAWRGQYRWIVAKQPNSGERLP